MNRFSGRGLIETIDWKLVAYYILLIIIGWVNIYASIHSSEPSSIFDPSCRSGKQFIWMAISIGFAALILFVLNPRIYESLSLPIYIVTLLLLIGVILIFTVLGYIASYIGVNLNIFGQYQNLFIRLMDIIQRSILGGL